MTEIFTKANVRGPTSRRKLRMGTIHRALAGLGFERGQTMAEYGLLLAAIALVVVVVAVTLGSSISHVFAATASRL